MMFRALLLAAAALCAAPASAQPGVAVTTVAEGLDHPWSVAFLPDGAMLVTERTGRLRVIENGALRADPVAGVPEVYARSQGGLFDVLPSPNFAADRTLFLSFAHGTPEANATRVVRAVFDGTALTQVTPIYTASPAKDTAVHYGGRIVFLPDGTLLVALGDGFNYREEAQNPASDLGKIVRIAADGGVPADNPLAGQAGARAEIWTLGHRNVQGLAIDPVSGRVYAHEHGPRGGDEINVIEKGANYGWPLATYGLDYSGAKISPYQTLPGKVDGIVVWTPSIAPSGLAFYTGALFPDWQGDLFVGGLVTKDVKRVDLDAAGKVLGQESLFGAEIAARVRDIRQGPDGALYVLTDEDDGKLLRIAPR